MSQLLLADLAWIDGQLDLIEQAMVCGIKARLNEPGVATDDVGSAWNAIEDLSRNDCAYDMPSIGPVYAFEFHAKRARQAARALHGRIGDAVARGVALDILDIGSGCGAVTWGAALVLLAMEQREVRFRLPLRIKECDSSPFMLRQAHLLWDAFTEAFPICRQLVERFPPDYGSWDRVQVPALRADGELWITGSFLLHASDAERSLLGDREFAESVAHLGDRTGASTMLTWHTRRKGEAARGAFFDLDPATWRVRQSEVSGSATARDLSLPKLTVLGRERFAAMHRRVFWCDSLPLSLVEAKRLLRHGVARCSRPSVFALNSEQRKTLDEAGRHLTVLGAAGSGKTALLVERVRRELQGEASLIRGRRVLVAAFNKAVVDQIGRWLRDGRLGDPVRSGWECDPDAGEGEWRLSLDHGTVDAWNMDKLPWRMGSSKGQVLLMWESESNVYSRVAEHLCIAGVDSEFLADEFRLVMAGRCGLDRAEYVGNASARRGRGHLLRLTEEEKASLWDRLDEVFAEARNTRPALSPSVPTTLSHARVELMKALEVNGGTHRRCDHVIVDEAQDFSRTDWRILNHLASPDATWSVAWDRTQAVHTGRTFDSPRRHVPQLARYHVKELRGAFRVPRTITAFAREFFPQSEVDDDPEAQRDVEVAVPRARMHSLPGPRPILVEAGNEGALASQVAAVLKVWSDVDPTINDEAALINAGGEEKKEVSRVWREPFKEVKFIEPRIDTVLRVKGLEFDTVIWRVGAQAESTDRLREELYTLFTRSRRLLVIARIWGCDSPGNALLEAVLSAKPHRVRCARYKTVGESTGTF